MKSKKKLPKRPLLLEEFIVWSVALHLLFYFSVAVLRKEPKPPPVAIEIEVAKPPPPVKQKKPPPPPPVVKAEPPPPPPKVVPPPIEEKQKFVEQKKVEQKQPPPKTNLLSASNQTVKHQTVAAKRPPVLDQKVQKGKISAPKLEKGGDIGTKVIETVKSPDGSPSFDYIQELDPGMETLLNTKETVFYDYYADLRRKINSVWSPIVRVKLSRIIADEKSASDVRDQVTKCLVSIDPQGNVLRVQVIGKSTFPDLDAAAAEAFKKASPFTKPPEGMLDVEGHILIRWDFIIDS